MEPAPPGSVKIVGGGISDVYIQDQEGQVYSCDAFTKEACWIPDVVPADYPKVEQCDQSGAAFLFYQKPPVDMTSCIQLYIVSPHFVGTLMFTLTKDGKIWEWQHGSMEYGFLLYPISLLGGAAGGLLLGSLIWIAVRTLRRPSGKATRITRNEAIILIIPWALLTLGLSAWLFQGMRSKSISSDNSAQYTAVAKEIAAQMTQIAGEQPSVVPRNTQHPLYDLIAMTCEATWEALYKNIPCPDQIPRDDAPFTVNSGQGTLSGYELPGTALAMPLNSDNFYISGIFPPTEIKTSDHFQAMIGCLDLVDWCDAIFEVSYETPDGYHTMLGRWRQVQDGEPAVIDLDLSELAGQSVRIKLGVRRYADASVQYPAWVSPSIGPR